MSSQLTEIALQMLGTIERMELIIPEITDTIRKALEEVAPTCKESLPVQLDDLALRVQKLEVMRETERAAVLDLYQQIDRLKRRQDWQYTKIGRLEDAITNDTEAQP
jgi:uncharacterized protein (UPF0335 family)